MKTIKELASEIAKREGKKTQARIGEIREILGILSDMVFADEWTADVLYNNGKKRMARKKKDK